MTKRKTLSFKSFDPKKVKIIGILFVVSFFAFPDVRYHTAEAFHTAGDIIHATAN